MPRWRAVVKGEGMRPVVGDGAEFGDCTGSPSGIVTEVTGHRTPEERAEAAEGVLRDMMAALFAVGPATTFTHGDLLRAMETRGVVLPVETPVETLADLDIGPSIKRRHGISLPVETKE